MKKVLIITGTLEYGGVQRLIVDTAKSLLKNENYYPIIYSLLNKSGLENELINSSVEYHSLNFKNLKNVIGNIMTMRKIIKNIQPNIIHTHQFASDFYGSLGALGLNIPIVSHIHNPRGSLSRKITRLILNRFFIDYFITTIEGKKRNSKCFILHNAIDPKNLILPENFSRSDYLKQFSIPENSQIIGSVGRLIPEKGYDFLLPAFKQVLDKIPNLFLILIGDGPEMEKLKNLATHLGAANRVIFTGYRKDIAALISILNVFVVSSRIESFSLVALEAMYLGIPVIITNKLLSKDIFSPAALVTNCSIEGLRHEIITLLNNQKQIEELIIKGKELVKRQFDINSYTIKLESIYNEILNNKKL